MYGSYQLSDRLYAGIAVNWPFGFATKPDNSSWAGAPIALTSQVRTLDFNPTLAYKITPELSIGVGTQAEYMRVGRTLFPRASTPSLGVEPRRVFRGNPHQPRPSVWAIALLSPRTFPA